MAESLMTAAEVAKQLQIHVETVYLLIQKDNLPAVKIGRQWRFDKAEVAHWLRTKRRRRGRTACPSEKEQL